MPLNPLSLDVTYGVAGRAYQATVQGLSTGSTLEVLSDGTPGFSTVNGRVYMGRLPGAYPTATVVLRETKAGETPRESRIDISIDGIAIGAAGVAATNLASGAVAPLDKLFRTMARALDNNIYDLPDYGSGPTAGKAAPTVTWTANPAGGRSQYRSANPADGDVNHTLYCGGVPFVATATSVGFPVVTSTLASFSTSGRSGVAWMVDTMTDDDGITIRHQYNATVQYRLLIDGQMINRAPAPQTNVNGGVQCLNIDFGSRSAKGRRVQYQSELNSDFRGFYIKPTARLWRPTPQDFVRAIWFGDSYGGSGTEASVPNSFAHDNYAGFTMKLLGVHDANHLCAAGTGLVRSVAQAQNYTGPARLSDIAYIQQKGPIDLAIIEGSINDNGNAQALITTNAAVLISSIRAQVGPSVPIIVLGVSPGSGLANGQAISNEQAVLAAVVASGDPLVAFVPFSTAVPAPIITGSGNAGTAALDGNADFYIRADQIHPTYGASPPSTGGMEYISRVIASGIRAAITAMRR